MDDMNDLDKRRLKGSLDNLKGMGETLRDKVDGMDSTGSGALLTELHRRGMPAHIDTSLLGWPNMGLTCSCGLLMGAGLPMSKLLDALKLFVDAIFSEDEVISATEQGDEIFNKLGLECDCASPVCPRSDLHIDQVTHAMLSSLVAIRAFMPEFVVPSMAGSTSNTDDVQKYEEACRLLLKHHIVEEKQKVTQIAEFLVLMQLKAGVIQVLAEPTVEKP